MDVVVESLGSFFTELRKDPQVVKDVINDEEEQFLRTLTRGQRLLNKTITSLGKTSSFPGDIVWRLYDTYGFPADLTQLMCEERGLTFDMRLFEEAKQKSVTASQQTGGEQVQGSFSFSRRDMRTFCNRLLRFSSLHSRRSRH